MHGRRQSLHGHHLLWDASPSDEPQVDLDADAGRFSVAKQYTVQLRLDCDRAQQPCIADGDSVETVLTLGSALDPDGLRSTVRILTEVESLLSCQSSTAWIGHELRSVPVSGSLVDVVPISTPILVHLLAKDVRALRGRRSASCLAVEASPCSGAEGRTSTLLPCLQISPGNQGFMISF
jgi:hypothetical protein